MKTLFVCHVEKMFERFMSNTYLNSIRSLAARGCYNRIIFLNSNIDEEMGRWDALRSIYAQDIDWGWGYEAEMFDHDEEERNQVISTGNVHEFTWVPPELRNVKQSDFGEVSLIGGARHECLSDFEAVLRHAGIEYKLLEGLVY